MIPYHLCAHIHDYVDFIYKEHLWEILYIAGKKYLIYGTIILEEIFFKY